MSNITEERNPLAVVQGVRTLEGEGFLVRRPFPTPQIDHFGPFLLLDEMGPSDNAPGDAKGAPDHPHRGFETVTYVLDGEVEHKDSMGNKGLIKPGDVQWMTAGAGIVHSEMPSDLIMTRGGRVHGFQLWVNLPAKAKMNRPRYQDLMREDMPIVEMDGGSAVIIGGKVFGVTGPADTHLPISYAHVRVDPGGVVRYEVEAGHIVFMYVFRGAGEVGAERRALQAGQIALFDEGGGIVPLYGADAGMELLLGAAQPLREPVVRYGPFVMNTRAEILKAFDDYQSGAMGRIEPELST